MVCRVWPWCVVCWVLVFLRFGRLLYRAMNTHAEPERGPSTVACDMCMRSHGSMREGALTQTLLLRLPPPLAAASCVSTDDWAASSSALTLLATSLAIRSGASTIDVTVLLAAVLRASAAAPGAFKIACCVASAASAAERLAASTARPGAFAASSNASIADCLLPRAHPVPPPAS